MDIFSENVNVDDLDSARKLLKESREAFMLLFNNSPICMSMTAISPEKRTYYRSNKKFREIFGYTEDEIVGRTSVEIGILDLEESVRVGNILKETGRIQNEYIRCIAKGGTIVHTISSIEKMVMNDKPYFVSFFINVTKVIEQQAIIEKQLQQLEAVNHELEAFSYSVSHDLRAPLRAINGYAKILATDFTNGMDEEGIKMLSQVQVNAKKMSNLIDDLLAFARLGKKSFIKKDIDMNMLVNEVVSELKSTHHQAKLIIGDLLPVKGDHSLIKQVVINLLSNAIKYSSKKEHPVIEITSERNNDKISYSVKDNGEGFDMKYIDKLFAVFQRLHSNEEFEGTGVGLAMVKRILIKHDGSIEASAKPGEGAIFKFTLPVN